MFLLALLPAALGYGFCADPICGMDCGFNPIETVVASSTLPGSYGTPLMLDSANETAWCEGVPGNGEGQTLRITLEQPQVLEVLMIYGGYFKSQELLAANGRIKTMSMVATNAAGEVVITDRLSFSDPVVPPEFHPCMQPGTPYTGTAEAWFRQAGSAGEMVWQKSGQTEPVVEIALTIEEVYPGSRYADTCISELLMFVR